MPRVRAKGVLMAAVILVVLLSGVPAPQWAMACGEGDEPIRYAGELPGGG